jgi:hypothetical protein
VCVCVFVHMLVIFVIGSHFIALPVLNCDPSISASLYS